MRGACHSASPHHTSTATTSWALRSVPSGTPPVCFWLRQQPRAPHPTSPARPTPPQRFAAPRAARSSLAPTSALPDWQVLASDELRDLADADADADVEIDLDTDEGATEPPLSRALPGGALATLVPPSSQRLDAFSALWSEFGRELELSEETVALIASQVAKGALPCDAGLLKARTVQLLQLEKKLPELRPRYLLSNSPYTLSIAPRRLLGSAKRVRKWLPARDLAPLLVQILPQLNTTPHVDILLLELLRLEAVLCPLWSGAALDPRLTRVWLTQRVQEYILADREAPKQQTHTNTYTDGLTGIQATVKDESPQGLALGAGIEDSAAGQGAVATRQRQQGLSSQADTGNTQSHTHARTQTDVTYDESQQGLSSQVDTGDTAGQGWVAATRRRRGKRAAQVPPASDAPGLTSPMGAAQAVGAQDVGSVRDASGLTLPMDAAPQSTGHQHVVGALTGFRFPDIDLVGDTYSVGVSTTSREGQDIGNEEGGLHSDGRLTLEGIKAVCEALIDALGREAAYAVVSRAPDLVLRLAPQDLRTRVPELQRVLKVRPEEAALIIQQRPRLLTVSEERLVAQVSALAVALGWPRPQVLSLCRTSPQSLLTAPPTVSSLWRQLQRAVAQRSAWKDTIDSDPARVLGVLVGCRNTSLALSRVSYLSQHPRDMRRATLEQVMLMTHPAFVRQCPGYYTWDRRQDGRR